MTNQKTQEVKLHKNTSFYRIRMIHLKWVITLHDKNGNSTDEVISPFDDYHHAVKYAVTQLEERGIEDLDKSNLPVGNIK